ALHSLLFLSLVAPSTADPSFGSVLSPRPRSTFFPYTTLFRSLLWFCRTGSEAPRWLEAAPGHQPHSKDRLPRAVRAQAPTQRQRSEEHTSELQSRENLVCRLLLEKKKNLLTHMEYPYSHQPYL